MRMDGFKEQFLTHLIHNFEVENESFIFYLNFE